MSPPPMTPTFLAIFISSRRPPDGGPFFQECREPLRRVGVGQTFVQVELLHVLEPLVELVAVRGEARRAAREAERAAGVAGDRREGRGELVVEARLVEDAVDQA